MCHESKETQIPTSGPVECETSPVFTDGFGLQGAGEMKRKTKKLKKKKKK